MEHKLKFKMDILIYSKWRVEQRTCNFIKKDTPAQVFSCGFCGIFKITFFPEHLSTTAFDLFKQSRKPLNFWFFVQESFIYYVRKIFRINNVFLLPGMHTYMCVSEG